MRLKRCEVWFNSSHNWVVGRADKSDYWRLNFGKHPAVRQVAICWVEVQRTCWTCVDIEKWCEGIIVVRCERVHPCLSRGNVQNATGKVDLKLWSFKQCQSVGVENFWCDSRTDVDEDKHEQARTYQLTNSWAWLAFPVYDVFAHQRVKVTSSRTHNLMMINVAKIQLEH